MAALGPRGRRVLVVGAGDGGVARLLLRYPVELVVQVEIDEVVVNASRQFFPHFAESYDDPRHLLVVGDAIQWVRNHSKDRYKSSRRRGPGAGSGRSGLFDLCVIDTTDN